MSPLAVLVWSKASDPHYPQHHPGLIPFRSLYHSPMINSSFCSKICIVLSIIGEIFVSWHQFFPYICAVSFCNKCFNLNKGTKNAEVYYLGIKSGILCQRWVFILQKQPFQSTMEKKRHWRLLWHIYFLVMIVNGIACNLTVRLLKKLCFRQGG